MMNIDYYFIFPDGTEKIIKIELDADSLEIKTEIPALMPDWVLISNCQCDICPLTNGNMIYCPIALNISVPIEFFKDYNSFDEVEVTVKTDIRDYYKRTTVQKSLSSLLGVYMVASGCPVMKKLKPMVRFHLPFASVEETITRVTGTYLLGQYFLNKQGKPADLELNNLIGFYKGIQNINMGIADRIRGIAGKDALNNAVICLDIFAKELPYAIEDELEDIKHLFSAYWDN